MKICIIGHFGGKKIFTDGQTVKTKEIKEFLVGEGFTVSSIDTYFLKRRPLASFLSIKRNMSQSDIIILVVSSRGYKVLSPYLIRINKRLSKRLFDFVIGGSRYRVIDNKLKFKTIMNGFTKIYVETERIKNEYQKRGLDNVGVIPNFKSLKRFCAKKDFIESDELHACTFSRVIEEKGIGDAIKAIRIANKIDGKKKYYLDIYGRIDSRYRDEFYYLLKKNSECVVYCGEAKPGDASKIINRYDVLLFPTYWRGEGFPGTLVDAFFAATPIIATEWNDNFEIMEEGRNGIKVKIKSPEEIAEAMRKLANNKKLLKEISKFNYDRAAKYGPKEAMAPFLSELNKKIVNGG